MRVPYLLAASLLTGLAIPASALSQMLIFLPEHSIVTWNLKQTSQITPSEKLIPNLPITSLKSSSQALQPRQGSQKILWEQNTPSVLNNSLPEFSTGVLQSPKSLQTTASENNLPPVEDLSQQFTQQEYSVPIASSLHQISQPSSWPLTSGNQLYYQRLAALKTGQIYTGTDINNLQSLREQAKKPQLTYEDWKNLLLLEAKAIASGQGTNRLSIIVGDSLTMWFPGEKLPNGKLWLNQGISGDTSNGVFKRLQAFSETRPEAIYLMVGINDLRRGASDETILRNHRRIIRRLRQTHPKTQIIVQSILPTRLPNIPNSRIRRINAKLAAIAQQEGGNYLNIHSWFTDNQGNLQVQLTTDGLHLSKEGYDVWKFAIQQIEFKLTQR